MPQRKHKPEEIVAKLRQVDVLLSQGRPVADAIRAISVTPFTYYRWRREFGGLKSDQVKRQIGRPPCAAARSSFSRSFRRWRSRLLREAASGTEGPRSETSEPRSPPPAASITS